jgi:hypothetical protein
MVGAVYVATRQPELAVVALSLKADEHAAPTMTETPKSEPPAPPAPPAQAEPARPDATAPASAESVPTVPATLSESKSSPTAVAPAHAQPGHPRPEPAETKNGEARATQAPAAAAPVRRPDATLAVVQPPAPVRPAPPARPTAPDQAIVPRAPAEPDAPGDPASRRRRRAPRGEPTSAPEPTLPTRSGSDLHLKIEVVVWAPDPKQRMVFVNGRKYVEGQRLTEEGAVLEQIVEDGDVLVHNGQRIRVKAGPD